MTPEAEDFLEEIVGAGATPPGVLTTLGYEEGTQFTAEPRGSSLTNADAVAGRTYATRADVRRRVIAAAAAAGVDTVKDAIEWVHSTYGDGIYSTMAEAAVAVGPEARDAWNEFATEQGGQTPDPFTGMDIAQAEVSVARLDGNGAIVDWVDVPQATVRGWGRIDGAPIIVPNWTEVDRIARLGTDPLQPLQVRVKLPDEVPQEWWAGEAYVSTTDATVDTRNAIERAAGFQVATDPATAAPRWDENNNPITEGGAEPTEGYTGPTTTPTGLPEGASAPLVTGNATQAATDDNFIYDPMYDGLRVAPLGFDQANISGVKVPVDENGNRIFPGSGATEAGRVEAMARWQPGDPQLFFASWTPEALAWMQSEMERAGIIAPLSYRSGVWDTVSQRAMENVMAYANVNGISGAGAMGMEGLTEDSDVGNLLGALQRMKDTQPPVPEFVAPRERMPDPSTLRAVIEDHFMQRVGRKPTSQEMAGYTARLQDDYRLSYTSERLRSEQEWITQKVNEGYLADREDQAVFDDQRADLPAIDPVSRFRELFEKTEIGSIRRADQQAGQQQMRDSIIGSAFVGRQG
ncbi:MAG: hypothetical protein ABIJ75_02490 [Actinomycetota bacterium]